MTTLHDYRQEPTTYEIEALIDKLERDASPVISDAQRLAAASMLRVLLPRIDAGIGQNDDGPCYFYERDFYALSNFSAFRVSWCGIDFQTAEHAYQWAKFAERPYGGDVVYADTLDALDARDDVCKKIIAARSAHDAFKLAESLAALRYPDWTDVRVDTMRRIISAKTRDHEYVRRKLWQSGDRLLVENSWRDSFWGWGDDRRGENMLGQLWMEIRAQLRAGGVFDKYEAARLGREQR